MGKTNYSQLELFSNSKDEAAANTGFSNSFLSYICNFEKAILLLIGFIVTGIIAFSLGVQKGKHNVIFSDNPRPIKIQQSSSSREIKPAQYQQEAPVIQKQGLTVQPATKDDASIQNYTIQVASYKTKAFAQKEAQALKKKGYTPLIFSKKGYVILCIGNFSNKDTAKSSLLELKKRYSDCLLRRL